MNTLRTFILFIFVMGIVVIFQVAIENRKNSIITNSNSLSDIPNSQPSIFSHKNYIYPNSVILDESITSITTSSSDSVMVVESWYRKNFSVKSSIFYGVIDQYMYFEDIKGHIFRMKMVSDNSRTIILIKL